MARAARPNSLWTQELLVIAALSALTRFWTLFRPREVVFDEVILLRFLGAYTTHAYYVDVHPPLARLILAASAWLLRIPGASMAAEQPTVLLRVAPALMGTLIAPLCYILVRQLGAGRRAATLAGLLVVLENALIVQSRYILVDSMLIASSLGAVCLYLAARERSGAGHWIALVGSAACAGVAVGTKWTGLNALGMVGVLWLVDAIERRRTRLGLEAAVLLLVPAAMYVGSFAAHFALSYKKGPHDWLMSNAFRATLVGDDLYQPGARMSFAAKFVDLHRVMILANRAMSGQSRLASRWYTWPIMKTPICYWFGPAHPDLRLASICLVGNPIIWWGVLLVFALMLAMVWRRRADFARVAPAIGVLALGYAINFLPFMFIGRVMYIYSYLLPLVYGICLAAVGIGILARSRAVYAVALALAFAGFLFFSPLTYGWTMTSAQQHARVWLPSWR